MKGTTKAIKVQVEEIHKYTWNNYNSNVYNKQWNISRKNSINKSKYKINYDSGCVLFKHVVCLWMRVLFYVSFVYLHECAYAFTFKVHCGSAFEPGAYGLHYYCTPPVCVPDAIGALAVWILVFSWNFLWLWRGTAWMSLSCLPETWRSWTREEGVYVGRRRRRRMFLYIVLILLVRPSGAATRFGWGYSPWLYFPSRVGGEVRIFGFYNNPQTNKKITPIPL